MAMKWLWKPKLTRRVSLMSNSSIWPKDEEWNMKVEWWRVKDVGWRMKRKWGEDNKIVKNFFHKIQEELMKKDFLVVLVLLTTESKVKNTSIRLYWEFDKRICLQIENCLALWAGIWATNVQKVQHVRTSCDFIC